MLIIIENDESQDCFKGLWSVIFPTRRAHYVGSVVTRQEKILDPKVCQQKFN